jgi:small subunit ribosomal protein S12e
MAEAVDQLTQEPIQKELTVMSSLKVVLKRAGQQNELARGLRECCRALDKKQARFCVLAENTTESQYKQLIQALCKTHEIDLIMIPDKMQLGEWVGLAKYDKQMKVRKVQKCSCAVVKFLDTKESFPELDFLINHFNKDKKQEE